MPSLSFVLFALLGAVALPRTRGMDLGLFEPKPLTPKTQGVQLAAYKYYGPLYSVPNLDARAPDLVTFMQQVNKPQAFGDQQIAWSEIYAMSSNRPKGFERYDGRTYTNRWAARITTQILVDHTNTFTFELDNREGAKMWVDGVLALDNDYNAERDSVIVSRSLHARAHLEAGYHDIRIDYYVGETWSTLVLWWSAPGVSRSIVPRDRFFLPDESCCLCQCKRGTCRVVDYGTGEVDCLPPQDDGTFGFETPLNPYERCEQEPCEDPTTAGGAVDPRVESPFNYYGN